MNADPLDRIWAATRPEEPSAEAFDALWAKVTARASRPAVLPMTGLAPWKKWGLGVAIVAQAAGLLIAASSALKPAAPVEIARVESPMMIGPDGVRVDSGYTTHVLLNDRGDVTAIVTRPHVRDEANTDILAAEDDVLNFMESYE